MTSVDAPGREPSPPPRWLRTPALVVMTLLALGVAVDTVAVVGDERYLNVIRDLRAGNDVAFDDAIRVEDFFNATGIAQLVAYVITAIAFLVWFRRAYRNLDALGFFGLRFTPGWAVGAWFVPILALFRPKQIANDIWRGSDPELAGEDAERWGARRVGTIVHVWWALWLISGWGSWIAGRTLFRAETLPDEESATLITLFADAVNMIAGIVAILFVRAVTRRQDALIAREIAAGA